MTIAFTGGGTGGHFYPLIAIAESVRKIAQERHLVEPKLYFFAPAPFDQNALSENAITYIPIPAGKQRRYSSFENVTGLFVTFGGVCVALVKLFKTYPDVVISKGGYGSVPTTIAAFILRIPVIIHESDAKPGRANLLASHWATRIAITFESAAAYFPKKAQEKIARTGIPIRTALMHTESEGARQYLELEEGIPTLLILGGSLGSKRINDTILSALMDLVSFANIIHQTGKNNLAEVEDISRVALEGNPHRARYHVFDYLSATALQRAAGAATLIISRAGSGTISEISLWKKPAILIPIPEEVSHDQRTNAYAFAATGAAVVIEETNLSSHLLVSEVKRIVDDAALAASMGARSGTFANPQAADTIADAALAIALSHEAV